MVSSHSEYHRLETVMLAPTSTFFKNKEKLTQQWQALNYLAEPHYETALTEYATFEALIKQIGVEILTLESEDTVSIDAIYCRDASIATDGGMILCRMGKEGRSMEPLVHERTFANLGIPVLGKIEAPGTLEGGDVAWLDEKTLAVGHTYRSNRAGIQQLRELLTPLGVEVIVAEMPHYKGPSDVFHLMSVLSPVDKGLAVVYSPLMPIHFRKELLNRGYELVEVPEGEFDSMGCNVLALAPRVCLMVEGNPVTKSRLENQGCTVYEYKGEEISLKGGGGPTCLTRPIKRIH